MRSCCSDDVLFVFHFFLDLLKLCNKGTTLTVRSKCNLFEISNHQN